MTDTSVRVLFLGDAAGAKKASGDVDSAMQNVSKSAKKASAESSAAFSGSMKNVSNSAESASKAIASSFAVAGKAVAITGAVIGATIVGGLIGATAEAIKFDAAMRNVNSLAGLSQKQFEGLSKQVLSLSKSTGQGPTVLAKGLYDIISSGFKAQAALTILKQSAISATAGLSDTATASAAIVAALNSWHIPAQDAKNVASDLFETVKQGVVTFPQLALQMGTLTSLAPDLGVSLQSVTAAFAALTLHGGDAATHATQVRAVLSSMLKPTKDLAAATKDAGFANTQAGISSLGFQGFLVKLSEVVDKNGLSIAKLFPNVRALAGFLGLTGKNAETAAKFLDRSNQAYRDGTEQSKAFLEQQKSISVQWQLTKSGIEAAAVPLGAIFFPALRSVLQEGAKFATFLTTLDKKRTITAKLDFVWNSVEGIGKHLWTQLSSAITGDSTKTQMVVPGTAVTFDTHDQGLASKFWDWFGKQIGTTPQKTTVTAGSIISFQSGDTTLRDQFTKAFQGINWAPIGAAIGAGISASIVISTKAFDAFGQMATAWANRNSGALANVGALIGLKVISTLLDPGFWLQHWQLIGGIALSVLPAGKFGEIGGKVAQLIFGKFGDLILPLFRDAMLRLPPAIGALGARFGAAIGDLIGKMGPIAVKATLDLVDSIIRGFSKGFGRLEPLVRVLLNTALVSAIGGVIGAAVSAAANLADKIWTTLGTVLGTGIGKIPALLAGGISSMGSAIVSEIVSAFSGLGSAIASKIESEISGIHIPTPHVHLGHVGAGPIQIPYPTSLTFAKGGEISHPMIATIGEDAPRYPEYIIPTNPKYAGRARGLLSGAANALGIPGFAAGGGPKAPLPKVKHPAKVPNRKSNPIKRGGSVAGPVGAQELGDIVAAANRALLGVTNAGQAVDDANTHYDLAARIADQSQETFLLDVPDDPNDPASATHQVRNEPDITKRLGELSYLQDLKQGLVSLMIDQKTKVQAAITSLQALIKRLVDDIKKLKDQVADQLAKAKKERTAQGADTRAANADRKSIATEEAKKKPNQSKIKGWRADATTHEAAAKLHGKNAEAADKQRDRLNNEISNRVDKIKDYTGNISDQRQSLLKQGIPYNIATAGLDLSDLQNEAASVSGTKGTLAAPIIPSGGTTTDTSSIDGTSTDDSALIAALQAQLAQARLALGLQTSQLSVIGGAQGFARGTLYVPDTGMTLIHRGESIATSDQTAARSGGASDSTPITIHISGVVALDDKIDARIEGSSRKLNLILGTAADTARRSNAFPS